MYSCLVNGDHGVRLAELARTVSRRTIVIFERGLIVVVVVCGVVCWASAAGVDIVG